MVFAIGGLPKCPKFGCSGHTLRLLVTVVFDDGFNTKDCSHYYICQQNEESA